jgi:hypothetical protein
MFDKTAYACQLAWILALLRGFDAPESAALDRVLAAYGDGEVDLVTSTATLKEIERYQDRNDQPSSRSSGFLKRYRTLASLYESE